MCAGGRDGRANVFEMCGHKLSAGRRCGSIHPTTKPGQREGNGAGPRPCTGRLGPIAIATGCRRGSPGLKHAQRGAGAGRSAEHEDCVQRAMAFSVPVSFLRALPPKGWSSHAVASRSSSQQQQQHVPWFARQWGSRPQVDLQQRAPPGPHGLCDRHVPKAVRALSSLARITARTARTCVEGRHLAAYLRLWQLRNMRVYLGAGLPPTPAKRKKNKSTRKDNSSDSGDERGQPC